MTKPLTIPNIPHIVQADPRVGESLQKIQESANQGVTGNRVPPPHKNGLKSINPTIVNA